MGKSFANFMCKKFFHPSSFANIKRVWLAEQRVKEETKKQDDLREEYEKDQDHYNNRQLMGDERVKHGLTFIYEAPKAYQKEADKETDGKLVWKRAATAQGSSSTAVGSSAGDGVVVRNVRCVKCNQMGHIPTDRECPLYKTTEEKPDGGPVHQDQLVEDMRRDGYAFKQSVLGRSIDDANYSKDLIGDDDSDDGPPPEEAFLNSLTKKQKKKLLKKLNRMEKKHSGSVHKKKNRHKRQRRSGSGSSEDEPGKHHREKKKRKRPRESSDDTTSSSEESSDGGHHQGKKSRRRCQSGRGDRDGRGGNRRDSSSGDERGSKVCNDRKLHPSDRHRGHGHKKERTSRDPGRSQNGHGQQQNDSSDDDRRTGSKPARQHRDRDSHDRHLSEHIRDKHYHKSSWEDRDSKDRDTSRIKNEKDRRDDRRDDRQDDRRDRGPSERHSKDYSDRKEDRYSKKDRK